MELELIRTYYPEGTNGQIFYLGRLMMYSIGLPWKDNQTGVSCIPEGKYGLKKRYSKRLIRSISRELGHNSISFRTCVVTCLDCLMFNDNINQARLDIAQLNARDSAILSSIMSELLLINGLN